MTTPIATSAIAQQPPVETLPEHGQTAAQWLGSHKAHVDEERAHGWTVGNHLETTWESANGREARPDTRQEGESDDDFVDRHFAEVASEMNENPPIAE